MNPNLKWKALFIFAVILFCLYFLFGYPVFPTSLAQVKDNFSKQIKLGLDLQGGTHLVLQVQVQEAVAQETDTTVDRLTRCCAQRTFITMKCAASTTRTSLFATSIRLKPRNSATWSPSNTTMSGTWLAQPVIPTLIR